MTDKEFKRLSRSQLIEIIYQLQLKQDELEADKEKLLKELEDKRLRVKGAGNIAEAALEIHSVMQAAQAAVIIAKARREAAEIVAQAKGERSDSDPAADGFNDEYEYNQQSIGGDE